MEFLLNNFITLMMGAFILFHIAAFVYDKFATKQTPDDWFGSMVTYSIMRKNYKRHPEFVGTKIKLGPDTHYISRDSNGNPERKPYV